MIRHLRATGEEQTGPRMMKRKETFVKQQKTCIAGSCHSRGPLDARGLILKLLPLLLPAHVLMWNSWKDGKSLSLEYLPF